MKWKQQEVNIKLDPTKLPFKRQQDHDKTNDKDEDTYLFLFVSGFFFFFQFAMAQFWWACDHKASIDSESCFWLIGGETHLVSGCL